MVAQPARVKLLRTLQELDISLGIQYAAHLVKADTFGGPVHSGCSDGDGDRRHPAPPSLPPRSYADVATHASPTTREASSETNRPKVTPSHVEATTKTEATQVRKGKGEGKAPQEYPQEPQQVHPDHQALIGGSHIAPLNTPTAAITPTRQPPKPARARQPPRSPSPTLARAIVLHRAPTKYKSGQMRHWIEEDNRGAFKFWEYTGCYKSIGEPGS